jgi:hypothetical protein
MAPVRVTRILEYQYESTTDALQDMDRWAVSPNGTIQFGKGSRVTRVRSAVIGPVFGESWELDLDAKDPP